MAKKEVKKTYTPEELVQLEDKILELAEKKGAAENYLFRKTFENYKFQLDLMERLKKSIKEDDLIVEKEYVKGRPSITIHPAINEFNKTCSAANGTVGTLIKIMGNFSKANNGSEPATAIYDFLNS